MRTRLGGSEFAGEQELHDALSVTGPEPRSTRKMPLTSYLPASLTEYFKVCFTHTVT